MSNQGSERTNGHVVVAVDGSGVSTLALAYAKHYAQALGRPMSAVAVWQIPMDAVITDDIQAATEAMLDETIAAAFGDAAGEIDRIVVRGHPVTVLKELSIGAELLVLGSRGHSGLTGALLGSVSGNLAAHAHCPVLVVKAEDAKPES